jgi:ribonuclease PH
MKRDDGRSATDLRPLKLEIGPLARMDGSGKFGFGESGAIPHRFPLGAAHAV